MTFKERGFTIVELLIVIVVIAILATIAIVSYTGIQKRAATVAYTSAADGLEKQMRIARITTGAPLTTTPGLQSVCLADLSELPATNAFAEGECRRDELASGTTTSYYANPTVSANLKAAGVQFPTHLPEAHITMIDGSRIHWRGVMAMLLSTGPFYLMWMPPDSSSCGRAINFIESMVAGIKADPQAEADAIATYGEGWETVIRNYYGGAGYCLLLVDN
jgi:prepilin-type N-terminal cleavage/methylation domain-containing protein